MECQRQYQAEWKLRNAARVRAWRLARDAKNAERNAELNRKWKAKHELHRQRKRTHGKSLAELLALHDRQGGCAVCRKPNLDGQDLHGDHDHTTGAFRGVLCRRCNTGIGMLGDTIAGLRAAVDYLERHEQLQRLL